MNIYNHRKDPKDERDFKLSDFLKTATVPTRAVDLRLSKQTPPILNQGNLGSCAGNELSNALRFCLENEHQKVFQPSRLYIYYFGRVLDGSDPTQDTGITIRSGLKAIAQYGAPTELDLPYDITKFAQKPSAAIQQDAKKYVSHFKYLLLYREKST